MGKREIWIGVGAVLLAAILSVASIWPRALATGAWGLSYASPGQTPAGPASARELAQYDAVYVGDTSRKVLYLTFDAGYENGCMPQILDTLEKHQIQACFFLVGNYLEKNPDLVRKMVQQGHTVANHTMHHPDMRKLGTMDAFRQELEALETLYQQIVGQPMPKYYRPPQGVYSRENLEMAKQLGYKTVFWSLAYADWNNDAQPTREQAFDKLLPRVHNGAVILLHATSKTNAQILDGLLT